MPGNRGGRGRGRGRGRGKVLKNSPVSETLPSQPSVPPPSTTSTSQYEVEYALVKKGVQATKKELNKLPSSVRKEYSERKKKKQLERILLPDAPERKRPRKNSPERTPCRLMVGTPSTPPPPKLQPWQISKLLAERILPVCGSRAASSSATLTVGSSQGTHPTTLPPPEKQTQRESAAQRILPVCGSRAASSSATLTVGSSQGTHPTTLPPPEKQTQRESAAQRILPVCGSRAASSSATLTVGSSQGTHPTTLPPPEKQTQRESAAQRILPVCGSHAASSSATLTVGSSQGTMAAAPPLSVCPFQRKSRLSLNMGSKSAESTLEAWIDQQMVEELSDEEESEEFSLLEENFNYVDTQPAHIPDELNLDAIDWLAAEDAKADKALHDLVPAEYLDFEWTNDPNSFHGRREKFTGNPGPTFPVDNLTPIDIFSKFFDDELFNLLVNETNKYSTFLIDRDYTTPNCRLTKWTNTDRCEMTRFLSILIFQGLFPLSVESEYWKENGYLTLKYFGNIMNYNRFILMKRVFHLTRNIATETLTEDDIKLRKIQPVLNILQKKFSTLYLPSQDIAIDESLLKWQGRLSFSQKIATKAAKVGIKSYELCESSTGYLWSFFVYTGKGTHDQTRDEQTDKEPETDRQIDLIDLTDDITNAEETDIQIDLTDDLINRPTDTTATSSGPPAPSNATARIVYDLAKPLFKKGHTLIMDNFYNSPLLSRYLKSQGTDVYGTIRLNREFVPESMKSVSKHEIRIGEVMQSYCKDLSIMLWRDANVVSLISTFHRGEVGGKEKYGRYKFKPQVVLDYNKSMGGVDKKDQLLSAHRMERVRNHVWYKKVFRRLLNITILNAYIIYKTRHPNMTHRKFRTILAEQLAQAGKPAEPMTKLVTVSWRDLGQTPRPKLSGNHFIGQGKSKRCVCVLCRKCRSKYICKQCNVTLCLDICFERYHS